MDTALRLAKLDKMPEDCGIIVPGKNIKKVLFGVDMDTAEIMLAKQLGYDCVVSHHPRNTNKDKLNVLEEAHIEKQEALRVPRNKSQ
jgi:putative NIF3 family GTP cyclohydrolase 1 type 2